MMTVVAVIVRGQAWWTRCSHGSWQELFHRCRWGDSSYTGEYCSCHEVCDDSRDEAECLNFCVRQEVVVGHDGGLVDGYAAIMPRF